MYTLSLYFALYFCFFLKNRTIGNQPKKKSKQTEKKTEKLHCSCCCWFVSVYVWRVRVGSKYINDEWELSVYSLLLSCSLFWCVWSKTELTQRHVCEVRRHINLLLWLLHFHFSLPQNACWCECVGKTVCSERESKCGCGCGSLFFALLWRFCVCVNVWFCVSEFVIIKSYL